LENDKTQFTLNPIEKVIKIH